MAHQFGLCIAGLFLVLAVAKGQFLAKSPSPKYNSSTPPQSPPPPLNTTYSPPPPPPPPLNKTYSPPPPPPLMISSSPPPNVTYSPPIPLNTTYSPPPPPTPKKFTTPPPPPSPSKKYSPPPPPKKLTPPPPSTKNSPPPPPKKLTPPPPSRKTSPPPPPAVVVVTPPPSTTYPPPPPQVVATPPPSTTYPPPPPQVVATPPPPPPPTPTSLPPPPAASVEKAKKVRCTNKLYSACYYREFTCPIACPYTCEVDCETCSPVCNCNKPGAVCQDPRFIGADGITFYFHGKKDQHFCLVTDPNLHINAHFIGKRNANMGRDFTWVQSLGILFDDHQLYIGAQKTTTWNDAMDRFALSFDGQPIVLPEGEGASWQYTPEGIRITRSKDTNSIVIEVEGQLKIKALVVPITKKESLIHNYGINEEDCFAHLDLSFKFYSLSGEVNGVLGQTYAKRYVSKVKMGVTMPVLGGEKKFSTSSLFATDCAVSRFVGESQDNDDANSFEFADLNCATGINGRGVVCKR